MGDKTGISWTDHTWNPWLGCTKVSAGCKNCYMFRDLKRFGGDPTLVRRSKTTFNAPMKWQEPALIFTCSWSDFFHERVKTTWLDDAWKIISQTPHLTYQILTKRPYNIQDALPDDWGEGYKNVWLGVTVENDDNVWRMEALSEIPAALHFVSYEPALGPLPPGFVSTYPTLKWLIAGGESGPDGRIPPPEWITDAAMQCREANVPFFFKQWGGVKLWDGVWGGDKLHGKQYHEFPKVQDER